jgi:hypothetical protein
MALKNLMARLQCRAADTPDTTCFVDTRAITQIGRLGEAVNDPAPEPPTDPNAWRELAAAYNDHHFTCGTCIAAGRGAVYGLRCGVGAALWNANQDSA